MADSGPMASTQATAGSMDGWRPPGLPQRKQPPGRPLRRPWYSCDYFCGDSSATLVLWSLWRLLFCGLRLVSGLFLLIYGLDCLSGVLCGLRFLSGVLYGLRCPLGVSLVSLFRSLISFFQLRLALRTSGRGQLSVLMRVQFTRGEFALSSSYSPPNTLRHRRRLV